jgi:hypothetical protein
MVGLREPNRANAQVHLLRGGADAAGQRPQGQPPPKEFAREFRWRAPRSLGAWAFLLRVTDRLAEEHALLGAQLELSRQSDAVAVVKPGREALRRGE